MVYTKLSEEIITKVSDIQRYCISKTNDKNSYFHFITYQLVTILESNKLSVKNKLDD